MKKLLIMLLLALPAAAVFAQNKTINDANAEARTVSSFHTLKVSHAFEIHLAAGNQESLAVSAGDKAFISQIKTEVKNGELHIWHDGGTIKHWNPAKLKLKLYISFKQLDNVELSDGCQVYAEGDWKDENLKKQLLKFNHTR